MKIKCTTVGIIGTNCYIVQKDGFSAVIDPGENPTFINTAIKEAFNDCPKYIILTHTHFDHVGALNDLHKLYPEAAIAMSEHSNPSTKLIKEQARSLLGAYYSSTCFSLEDFEVPKPNLLLKDNDTIGPFKVLYTPGHTMDSICLYSPEDNVLFSGDTLFCGSYGRTDLGGSFQDIKTSIIRLLKLPQDTLVLPGHGESTNIGDEQQLAFII